MASWFCFSRDLSFCSATDPPTTVMVMNVTGVGNESVWWNVTTAMPNETTTATTTTEVLSTTPRPATTLRPVFTTAKATTTTTTNLTTMTTNLTTTTNLTMTTTIGPEVTTEEYIPFYTGECATNITGKCDSCIRDLFFWDRGPNETEADRGRKAMLSSPLCVLKTGQLGVDERGKTRRTGKGEVGCAENQLCSDFLVILQTCDDIWADCDRWVDFCPGQKGEFEPTAAQVKLNCAGTCKLCANGRGTSTTSAAVDVVIVRPVDVLLVLVTCRQMLDFPLRMFCSFWR